MFIEQQIHSILSNQLKLFEMIEKIKNPKDQELKVYSLEQVAEIFHVTLRTIYNWKEQGILPCTIIGSKSYLTEAQLQEFLKEHEVKPLVKGRVK